MLYNPIYLHEVHKYREEMEKIIDRFLRYVAIDTQSDDKATCQPSTGKQLNLLRLLNEELRAMGVESHLDHNGYVMASIPSNSAKDCPAIGFIAHVDTSPDASGTNIRPQIIENYDGSDIPLSPEDRSEDRSEDKSEDKSEDRSKDRSKDRSEDRSEDRKDSEQTGLVLKTEDFPELLNYIGQTIITTDGTTLLGADDKAGVAEIMQAAQYIMEHPEFEHGDIKIAFTPDEEVGRGTEHFDVKAFGARYAYTMDGGAIGELEYENFNAAEATVHIQGRNIHPGYAKGKMKNALLIGMEFNDLLPADQRPECTSGYEGFYHITDFNGTVEETQIHYIIRDHDSASYEAKIDFIKECASLINQKYGENTVSITIHHQYSNMKKEVEPHLHIIEKAKKAMVMEGITPIVQPIRGGTDGANLSYMGIPCPNIFAGGHNFHGKLEFVPLESMEKAYKVILNLVSLFL